MKYRLDFRKYKTNILNTIISLTLIDFFLTAGVLLRNQIVLCNKTDYKSEQELKEDIAINTKKLGLKNLDISLNVLKEYNKAGVCKYYRIGSRDLCQIIIREKDLSKEVVRHELYHASRTKLRLDKEEFFKDRLFSYHPFNLIEEWQATSYAIQD